MKKARFTQDQIIGILKEHQAGATTADLCRRHGIAMRPSTRGDRNTAGWKCRKRGGRKRALGTRSPMMLPDGPNQRWSLDFVSDALKTDGGSAC